MCQLVYLYDHITSSGSFSISGVTDLTLPEKFSISMSVKLSRTTFMRPNIKAGENIASATALDAQKGFAGVRSVIPECLTAVLIF